MLRYGIYIGANLFFEIMREMFKLRQLSKDSMV